jgi:DAACS family dicarboxylate/amino acid:cation (Na+ or H+) symporter
VRLETKIFLGLIAGAAVGAAARIEAAPAALLGRVVIGAEPLGTIFIRLVTMVVVPLVIASLFTGIASLGDVRRLGGIGGRTLAYFLLTTLAAAAIGLAVAIGSGVGGGADAATRAALSSLAPPTPNVPAPGGLVAAIVELVPQNPIAAAAAGDLLPLIVAVCIFGAAATALPEERRRPLVAFFESVNDLSMVVIRWLMRLAPPAVFLLIAGAVARAGASVLGSLATFALVAVGAMAVHVAITLVPALRFGARLSLTSFSRKVSDALLLAFSTASSNATLPVSMEAATQRLGVTNEVAGFVLPAGATINKNGSAIYKAVTAVFLARLYGLELGSGEMLGIVLASTAAAFAGAGVPGSSLVTTLIVLDAIGLGTHAAAGIALVASIDRPLDMCRSLVNTLSNLIGAAWIQRSTAAAVSDVTTSSSPLVSIGTVE